MRNLVVGENVSMGSNAKISWVQVTGTGNVAELDDIPDDEYITEITKNTITTGYINALGVTAASVKSDWVYAGEINANQVNAGILKGVTALFTETDGAYWACGVSSMSEVASGKNCDWVCDTNGLSGYNGTSNTIRLIPDSGEIHCEEIYLSHKWLKGWELGAAMQWLDEKIDELASIIDEQWRDYSSISRALSQAGY